MQNWWTGDCTVCITGAIIKGDEGQPKRLNEDGSPVTRWASIAFGAGVGIGSAYSECSQKFDAANTLASKVDKLCCLVRGEVGAREGGCCITHRCGLKNENDGEGAVDGDKDPNKPPSCPPSLVSMLIRKDQKGCSWLLETIVPCGFHGETK
ncbi:hypothetical protein R6Q59_013788 [Mikania micrantha]